MSAIDKFVDVLVSEGTTGLPSDRVQFGDDSPRRKYLETLWMLTVCRYSIQVGRVGKKLTAIESELWHMNARKRVVHDCGFESAGQLVLRAARYGDVAVRLEQDVRLRGWSASGTVAMCVVFAAIYSDMNMIKIAVGMAELYDPDDHAAVFESSHSYRTFDNYYVR